VRLSLPRQGGFLLERALDATIPAADEKARSFRAIARLEPTDGAPASLKPGMFVEVELLLQPLRGTLLVASDAVLANEQGTYVVRAAAAPKPPGDPGANGDAPPGLVADFVPVRVLAQAGGRSAVEPIGGVLEPGDSVLLTGADNAAPGAMLLPRVEANESVPGKESPR
jgi:multidrug efflux pump subunit AcrA (membrane-fusion protein)